MRLLRYFCAALRFLTIIPLPGTIGTDRDALKGAVFFFPVVGIGLGLIAAGSAWLAWELLPPLVAGVLVTMVLFSLSGAFHLDGLADCADGFFSARDRAKMLEIMRDSRIGVMGVVAVFSALLLKVSALSCLGQADAVRITFLMPVAGRCALIVMIALLPYVRREGGLGTPFYSAGPVPLLVTALPVLFGSGAVLAGFKGVTATMAVLVLLFFFARLCHRKIGGATGDCLGAACELAETAMVVFMLPDFPV